MTNCRVVAKEGVRKQHRSVVYIIQLQSDVNKIVKSGLESRRRMLKDETSRNAFGEKIMEVLGELFSGEHLHISAIFLILCSKLTTKCFDQISYVEIYVGLRVTDKHQTKLQILTIAFLYINSGRENFSYYGVIIWNYST